MAPTLVAVVQQQTRVQLTLTWPGIQQATIQRLDPDGVFRNVRNAEPIACLGSCVAYDHEAPLDVAVSYRATSPQGSGAVNSNIYFEGGTTSPWVGGNGAAIAPSSTQKHEGGSAMRLTPDGVTAGSQAVSEAIPVTVGTTYGGGAWLWATSNSTWRVGINWHDAGDIFVTANNMSLALTAGTWTFLGGSWVAPASPPGVAKAHLVVSASGTPAGANLLYADETMLTSPAALIVTSSSVTSPSGGQAWLTHPGHPQYAGIAGVTRDGLTELRPARRGIFAPIGAELPIAVSDVRGGASGTLIVQTNSAADVTRLRSMLLDGSPLMLRQPLTWGGDSWWVSIGDAGVDRFTRIATDTWRRWSLPYQRVDRPSGASDGAVGQTWNDVKATYATWNAEKAAKATWTALNQSVT